MRTLCTFLIALVVQGAVPQGPPSSVEGDVVLFGSNEPVPMTLVELRRVQTISSVGGQPAGLPPGLDITGLIARPQPQPPLTTMTNGAGHFQFAAVPPGMDSAAHRARGFHFRLMADGPMPEFGCRWRRRAPSAAE
jgi:hypothetical protein